MTQFRKRRVVRALVVGFLLSAFVAPMSAWAGPAMGEECHGCCPEVIRAADLPDCCVVTPERSTVPEPVRANGITSSGEAMVVPPVVTWAQPPAPTGWPVTGDPPPRSMPVLLRTSVLLI